MTRFLTISLLCWGAVAHACPPGQRLVSAYGIEPSYTGQADQTIYTVPAGKRLTITHAWLSAAGPTEGGDIGCYVSLSAVFDGEAYPQRVLAGVLAARTGLFSWFQRGDPAALNLSTYDVDVVVGATYSGGRGTVHVTQQDYYGRPCVKIADVGFLGCEGTAP